MRARFLRASSHSARPRSAAPAARLPRMAPTSVPVVRPGDVEVEDEEDEDVEVEGEDEMLDVGVGVAEEKTGTTDDDDDDDDDGDSALTSHMSML